MSKNSGYFSSTFAALGNRNFAILWAGSGLAFTAFFMSTIVQAIVAFELTGKNSAVGIVLLGQGLAMAILGPFGGAIADRAPKRMVTAICQTGITVVFFVTGLLIALDQITILLLTVGSFAIGTGFAFMGPARQAWVVELVEERLRPNAVALNQVALNASRIIAPAVGAFLVAIAFIGAGGAYLFMAALYVIVVLSLIWLPATKPSPPSGRSVMQDLGAGFRYVGSRPKLRYMTIFFFLMVMLSLSAITVLPGFLKNELGRDIELIGPLQTIGAVGGLAVSVIVAPMAGTKRAFPVYTSMAVLTGVSLILWALSPTLLISFGPAFLYGIGTGGFQTLNMAVIVMEADPAYFGRVSSLAMLAFAGFMLAGFPVGLAADKWGEANTLAGLGVIILVIVAMFAPLMARAPSAQEERPSAEAAG